MFKDNFLGLLPLFDAADDKSGTNTDKPEEKQGETKEKKITDKKLSFDELLEDKEYQSEFDRRIQQALETNKKNIAAKNKEKEASETSGAQVQASETIATQEQSNPYMQKYAQEATKLAMVQNGIDVAKTEYAVNLINTDAIMDEKGDLDLTKLNEEISKISEVFPELKSQKKETRIQKIGADNEQQTSEQDLVAKALGL